MQRSQTYFYQMVENTTIPWTQFYKCDYLRQLEIVLVPIVCRVEKQMQLDTLQSCHSCGSDLNLMNRFSKKEKNS